ncbi:MAG: ribosomal protein S18-alanine N-acetyltransferase [Alphaproteobacteria bacterium]
MKGACPSYGSAPGTGGFSLWGGNLFSLARTFFVLTTKANLLLAPLLPDDANAVTAVHQRSFSRPWTVADFKRFANAPECHSVVAWRDGVVAGFIVINIAGGDAEVLTIAIAPEWRRQGIASLLLTRAMEDAASRGAEALFLEVGVRNDAACALYKRLGFICAGRRAKYYITPDGPEDALVMRCSLEHTAANRVV